MIEKKSVIFETAGEENEEELKIDLSRFNQAVIWGTDWTTETIAGQLKKGNIDLNPSFQRRDAWSEQEKSKLIESLMLGFPVPPIILAENKKKKNSYIVIDGKQRLLSIRRFYAGVSEEEFKEKNLQEKQVFKQLKLKGLDILKDFNGKSYRQLEVENSDYINNLDNQSIRTIVIKNWPDEGFLYSVFLRLNTGSKKLSSQELRQALKPGPFLDFLDDETANSKVIKEMLNNKNPDPRMKDIELALRYFAFKCFPEQYQGNLKEFLDTTCENLNKSWENSELQIRELFQELENTIVYLTELFRPDSVFCRYKDGTCSGRFNRAIYEVLTYYFSFHEIRSAIDQKKELFVEKFVKLNDNSMFIHAVSDTTKEIHRVDLRFSLIADLLETVIGKEKSYVKIPRLALEEGRFVVVKAE